MFQSTPPHEGRQTARDSVLTSGQFQSTPPHEGRPVYSSSRSCFLLFQSTPPHEGRPYARAALLVASGVSIHAPA